MLKIISFLIIITSVLSVFVSLQAQEQTVGLFLNDSSAYDGYTLFAPLDYTTTYLIDNSGLLIHSWENSYRPCNPVYLLENGNLLRPALEGHPNFPNDGAGGRVQILDRDGTVLWDFPYISDQYIQHHDVKMLPNGNILMIVWEYITKEEALAAGRRPDLIPRSDRVLPDYIIEVEPLGPTTGNIVWKWRIWDHLIQDYDSTKENYGVVEEHPELIDVNFGQSMARRGPDDWTHTNGIDYNEAFDQILLSVPAFSEVWIIDHSTTIEEAAGHTGGNSGKGGDLLYRWGNPQAYRAGDEEDRKFYGVHDANWIKVGYPGEGNILVFCNGGSRPDGSYSTVEEIVPPVDENGNYPLTPGSSYRPDEQLWIYYNVENPSDFYARWVSGAQRLANGNTLICNGPYGTFFEVTQEKEIVWEYLNPVIDDGPLTQGECLPPGHLGNKNKVFKIRRYAPDYPGLSGYDLTPQGPIELYPAIFRGDANGDEEITITDIELLINYLFRGGFPPLPAQAGDVNGAGGISIIDVVYLINYVLKSGPPPGCP